MEVESAKMWRPIWGPITSVEAHPAALAFHQIIPSAGYGCTSSAGSSPWSVGVSGARAVHDRQTAGLAA